MDSLLSARNESSRREDGALRCASPSQHMWFGMPLEAQPTDMDRGRRVPQLLIEIRRQLMDSGALEEEGIFRIPAQSQMLSFVRQRLESHENPEAVLTGCSSEVLAGLLKLWLKELPGGLWPVSTSPRTNLPVKATTKNTEGFVGRLRHRRAPGDRGRSSSSCEVDAESELQAELQCLSNQHAISGVLKHSMSMLQRELLLWLLDLLLDAAAAEESSRMGVRALSVIFGPLFTTKITDDMSMEEQVQKTRDGVLMCERFIALHREGLLTGRAAGLDGVKTPEKKPNDFALRGTRECSHWSSDCTSIDSHSLIDSPRGAEGQIGIVSSDL
eukprot:285894-Pleurochrysis_carterae.AAC.2